MPELPEVQSTVDYLSPKLKGRTLRGCSIYWARTLATHSPKKFENLILNQKITKVTRRGKFIVIWLSDAALLIHLRMSGTVEVVSSSIKADPYDRIIFSLDNNKELRFNDVRKFGKIYLCPEPETVLGKLGIEPLTPEFSSELLSKMLERKNGAIKPLLLNQSFIAGIGNIYADESLWMSKIHPKRLASTLSKKEISALYTSIVQVLKEAISLKGTDNGDEVVEGGLYEPKVYGKSEAPCLRCGYQIQRIVVGQRGTHFCFKCQKLKN